MNNPTASIIIIGSEILSGYTLDLNTQHIALELARKGIDLMETRTISDDQGMIVKYVKEFSEKYDYVFTTGGLGPTHDDITTDAIALAFGVGCVLSSQIYNILKEYCDQKQEILNAAQKKMAYIPEGAGLIPHDASIVPGFFIHNVYAMAGIPDIMKSMLKAILSQLKDGKVVKSKNIKVMLAERKIAIQLADLQAQYPDIAIGSYPFSEGDQYGTHLVLRSSNYLGLDKAYSKLQDICNDVLSSDVRK